MTDALIRTSNDIITFRTGNFPVKVLKDLLPDIETALFFARVYDLDAAEVAALLTRTQKPKALTALIGQADQHSQTLQDYVVEMFFDPDAGGWTYSVAAELGLPVQPEPVDAELLPELFKAHELEIADSIQQVAEQLKSTLGRMPGRAGEMVFRSLSVMNAKRPTIGDYRAHIQHQPVPDVLVVFDVSGSMSEPTVRAIVDEVVGLAYEANASLAIVSNTMFFWEAGSYSTEVVLEAAEYGGTQYEMLRPAFDGRAWDMVVTVADYDSSPGAKSAAATWNTHIEEILDVSLVHRSTYLAECLGQHADTVRPILVAQSSLTDQYGWS